MRAGQSLSLILAVGVLGLGEARAQMPWPSDGARPAATAPWPGGGGAAPAPMPGTVAPPGMGPMGAPSMGAPPQGGMPPCMGEFTKLREEVQKRAMAAKAASERKVAREEMCKHITEYSSAELKWVKFTEANVSTCGIPQQVAQQLKQVHVHTEQTRQKVCAAQPDRK